VQAGFFDDLSGQVAARGGEVLKDSRVRWVATIPLEGGETLFVKRFRIAGRLQRFRYAILSSQVKKEWLVSRFLSLRGILTPRALGILERSDFVKVVELDEPKLEVRYIDHQDPTSEAFLHGYIYGERPDVNTIFHGECDLITRNARRLGIPETLLEQPPGTPALAYQVLAVLDVYPITNCLVMKNHGEIYLGKDMPDAGNLALEILRIAKKL